MGEILRCYKPTSVDRVSDKHIILRHGEICGIIFIVRIGIIIPEMSRENGP